MRLLVGFTRYCGIVPFGAIFLVGLDFSILFGSSRLFLEDLSIFMNPLKVFMAITAIAKFISADQTKQTISQMPAVAVDVNRRGCNG